METAVMALLSLCVGGPLLGGLLFYLWPYSPMGRRLIKATEENVTVASMAANVELEGLRGKIGRTVSPLRPSGVAVFDGRRDRRHHRGDDGRSRPVGQVRRGSGE